MGIGTRGHWENMPPAPTKFSAMCCARLSQVLCYAKLSVHRLVDTSNGICSSLNSHSFSMMKMAGCDRNKQLFMLCSNL